LVLRWSRFAQIISMAILSGAWRYFDGRARSPVDAARGPKELTARRRRAVEEVRVHTD
jgi:hypothetical protein